VAEQRQRSDIVVGGRSVHEILHCLQNGQAQVLRGQVGRSLQGVPRAFQAEFIVVVLGFHNSARDHQKHCSGPQGASGGAVSGMREDAQRQAAGLQLSDAGIIAQ